MIPEAQPQSVEIRCPLCSGLLGTVTDGSTIVGVRRGRTARAVPDGEGGIRFDDGIRRRQSGKVRPLDRGLDIVLECLHKHRTLPLTSEWVRDEAAAQADAGWSSFTLPRNKMGPSRNLAH